MTGPDAGADGDYGYDLAHEGGGGSGPRRGPSSAREPAPARGHDPHGDGPRDEPRGDPGGDLGYDEAHPS
jgi:hypothetical protein